MGALIDLSNNAMQAYLSGDTAAIDNQLDGKGISGATGYMRFNGNTGDWIVGQNAVASQPSLWAFHCLQAKAQWIGWSNGKVHDRKSALIIEGGFNVLPAAHELPKLEKVKQMDGWKQQVIMPVFDMEGEYGQMELSLHADDDRRPVWKLLREWNDYCKTHRTASEPVLIPIVEIGSYSFDSQGGKKYGPEMTITDWMTPSEMEEQLATDADVDDTAEKEPPAEESKPKTPGARFGGRKGGRA
jgi:hypothetical protein